MPCPCPIAGVQEIKWTRASYFVYCQIPYLFLWISALWAERKQFVQKKIEYLNTKLFCQWKKMLSPKKKIPLYLKSQLSYLSESDSQDLLISLGRSSSEWNLLRPLRWTACATEKLVLPAAQASIMDTLRSDCRKRCRQLSDSSRRLWRTLRNKRQKWVSVGTKWKQK